MKAVVKVKNAADFPKFIEGLKCLKIGPGRVKMDPGSIVAAAGKLYLEARSKALERGHTSVPLKKSLVTLRP